MQTHEVLNQPPPLVGYDLFASDAPLRESVEREGGDWAVDLLHRIGRLAGTETAISWGFQANANPPQLRTFDRFGDYRIAFFTAGSLALIALGALSFARPPGKGASVESRPSKLPRLALGSRPFADRGSS